MYKNGSELRENYQFSFASAHSCSLKVRKKMEFTTILSFEMEEIIRQLGRTDQLYLKKLLLERLAAIAQKEVSVF